MRIFLFFLTLLSFTLQAEIIEIKQLKEVKKHLNPKTLIIFDIDNTLIEAAQEMGNDQWFRSICNQYKKEGLDANHALEKALLAFIAVQSITKVHTVEPNTPQFVSNLQEKNYPIIGLTTREIILSIPTIEQLQSVSIDLSRTSPFNGEYFFEATKKLLFRGGIVFTSGTHKGQALFTFLNKMNYTPKRILFINDKASHLRDIEETCEEKGIPFVGLRYGYLDENVKNFKPEIAEVQFQHFRQLLSNEKAQKVLQAKETILQKR